MHISTILALALTPLFPLVLSTHLLISIPASQFLPQPSNLPPSTTATLTTLHHIHTSPLRSDNTFDFRNVTSGSYLLDIHCRTHAFAPLRVDVSEGGKDSQGEEVEVWTTFRGNEWGNKGETLGVREVEGRVGIWGFEARAIGVKEYLIERPGFSPLSLLKNPMILIAGVSMVVVFGMPYLMDNMDPEMKAEFEERQKSSAVNPTANPLQNFDAAAWLAGSSGSSTKKGDSEKGVEKGITR